MNALTKIAGYQKEKEELSALIEIFNEREKHEARGATLPRGIIFYGEPGNGKTLFSEVLAESCNLKRININLSEATTDINICRQIRRAFSKAERNRTPTMIFFDELDKVLPNDYEQYHTDRAKSILVQLLTLIDGMEKASNIVFVATCNDYYDLPPSLVRPGRFDKKICLDLPNLTSRKDILSLYMNESPAHFAMSIDSIVKLTQGFSCAALKTLVNECLLRSDENCFVSEALIREKIREIKEEDLTDERSDPAKMLDAVRNVGAFLISRSYHSAPYLLTLENNKVGSAYLDRILIDAARDDDDDYYDDDEDENCENEAISQEIQNAKNMPFSKNDYIAAITAILGSYAAEEIVFGKIYDNLRELLDSLDTILYNMAKNGMLGLSLLFKDHSYSDCTYPDSYFERLYQAFDKIKTDCYDKARGIIEKNKALLEKLAALLVQKESLEKAECETLLTELGGITV